MQISETNVPNPVLTVLISTFNERILGLRTSNFPFHPLVRYIVNHQLWQCDFSGKLVPEEILNRHDFKIVQTNNVGLSVNRNYCLKLLNTEIGLIADDDVVFSSDAFDTIIRAFNDNSDSGIVTFKVKTFMQKPFKRYANHPFVHNIWSLTKVSSIEIAFRKELIDKLSLKFDERFGIGSEFCSGEENLFLITAYRKGARLLFMPEYICMHPEITSHKRMGLNKEAVKKIGAFYAVIWGRICYLFLLALCLKHYFYNLSCKEIFLLWQHGICGARKILYPSR